MLAVLLPILEQIVPPLAAELWKIIQDALQSKIDHATAVAQLQSALTSAAASLGQLHDSLSKADAEFKQRLADLAAAKK